MDEKPAFTRAQFLLYILLFMSAMLATVTADNLMALFVFWEMTSLLSFLLVGFDSTKLAARKAALQSYACHGRRRAVAARRHHPDRKVTADTFSINALMADFLRVDAEPALQRDHHPDDGGRLHQIRAGAVPFLAAQRHGRTDPGLGLSAFRHHGEAGRVPARHDGADLQPGRLVRPDVVAFGGATMLIAALQACAHGLQGGAGLLDRGLAGHHHHADRSRGRGRGGGATVGFILAHALLQWQPCSSAPASSSTPPASRGSAGSGGWHRSCRSRRAQRCLPAISAAGLPPSVGFISKEYLFEAQLESTFTTIAVLIGVLVNTVMVAIAVVGG